MSLTLGETTTYGVDFLEQGPELVERALRKLGGTMLVEGSTEGAIQDFSQTTDEGIDNQEQSPIEAIREILDTEGFYNAAAMEINGVTYLLGRSLSEPGKEGEPDISSLVLITLGPDGNVAARKEVWRPAPGRNTLEDARALILPSGDIAIGLTSVVKQGEDYIPYPAVMVVSPEDLISGNLPEPEAITQLGSGSDTTPLDENVPVAGKNVTAMDETSGETTYVYRPEGDKNNKRLRVFSYRDGTVAGGDFVRLPEGLPDWMDFRLGTTMPPIWLKDSEGNSTNEAIFLIHGIRIRESDGKKIYSIGSSRLTKEQADKNIEYLIDNIDPVPLIHPDLFSQMFPEDEVELHKERRVVYCCGGVPVYENGKLAYLKLYINVGDKRTVEVTLSADKLTQGWQANN